MNYTFSNFFHNSHFSLTDFNCANFDQKEGERSYYKIIWAKDNDVMVGVDGYHVTIMKDHIGYFTPLNILRVEPYTKGAVSYSFNREFYCIRDHDKEVSCNGFLFFGSSLPPMLKLDEKEKESFDLLLRFFIEEFENKDHIQGEMLMVLLKRFLLKSTRLMKENLIDPGLKDDKLDIIRQYNLLVETHFREKHRVADYADLLYKSPKTLANLFAKFNNLSPSMVINQRIILETKRLLRFSDKHLSEISEELGFAETSHFSKFFKKQVGISPREYKNSQP